MATKDHFNKAAEQYIQNRISPYNLTTNEKEQVWQLAQDREKSIQAERDDYRGNWQDRFKNEIDRLKGQQKPELQYNHPGNRQLPTDMQIRRMAQDNVQRNHLGAIRDIERTTDQRIGAILDHARKEGRGPQQREQNHTQENNRDHDRR